MAQTSATFGSVALENATWYQGSRYSYPLTGHHTGGALAAIDILKRRGSEPPLHLHQNEHEIFVVLEGQTEFHSPLGVASAHPGAIAFLPKAIPHTFRICQDWGKLLVLVAPSGFENYLLPFSPPATHLGMPPEPGELDIPALIARGAEFGIDFFPPNTDVTKVPYHQPDGLVPFVQSRDDGETLDILGITTIVKVSAADSAGTLSVFVTVDPPKVGPPLHTHSREDETICVMEGDYLIHDGAGIRPARPGDWAHFPKGVPHTYANAGDQPGRLLIVTTPGGYEAFFRDVHDSGRDRDKFMAVAANHGLEICGPPITVP
ncbi:MAG: hypothetical protein AMXMBFR84_20590 [Candidatus Hydrogenedentota bacterium]